MSAEALRDDFLGSLIHLEAILDKITPNTGAGLLLLEGDLHTVSEGLFLYAFTRWEQFARNLLIEDVTTNPSSEVHRLGKDFHDPEAPRRFATLLLQHPDHPNKFIEWSNYQEVISRANQLLGAGNRFAAAPLPRRNELENLKRVRNAIAHRSDKAWVSFLNLCEDVPYSVPATDMAGMTPGRFLIAYNHNGASILRDTLTLLQGNARHLVP